MASLFDDYVDKPISEMTAREKITFIWHNMVYQKQYRKRKITQGKEHKEIIIDENNPANWYCKNILSKN